MKNTFVGCLGVLGLALLGCATQQRTPPKVYVPPPVAIPAAPSGPPVATTPPPSFPVVPGPTAPPGGFPVAPPPTNPAPPPGGFPMAPPPATNPAPPPGGFPTAPPSTGFYPPPKAPCDTCEKTPSPAPMFAPPPDTKVDYRWQPAPADKQAIPPQTPAPVPPQVQENRVQLGTPEPIASPDAGKLKQSPEPPALQPGKETLSATIPQFHKIRLGVSAGLRPSLEGLDWLKDNGYKTVIHLRAPNEVDDADRREIEKRGLKYLRLEISPQTVSRTILAEFAQLVRQNDLHPTFVYDQDGVLAGAVWYWYFRTVEQDFDDVARIRARPLGLRETAEGRAGEMWQAIARIVNEN